MSFSITALHKQIENAHKMVHHLTMLSALSSQLSVTVCQTDPKIVTGLFENQFQPMQERFKWYIGNEWLIQSKCAMHAHMFTEEQHKEHGALLLAFPNWDPNIQPIGSVSMRKYDLELLEEINQYPSKAVLSFLGNKLSANLESIKINH